MATTQFFWAQEPGVQKMVKLDHFLSVTFWAPGEPLESDFESLFRGHSARNMAILTPDLGDLAPVLP